MPSKALWIQPTNSPVTLHAQFKLASSARRCQFTEATLLQSALTCQFPSSSFWAHIIFSKRLTLQDGVVGHRRSWLGFLHLFRSKGCTRPDCRLVIYPQLQRIVLFDIGRRCGRRGAEQRRNRKENPARRDRLFLFTICRTFVLLFASLCVRSASTAAREPKMYISRILTSTLLHALVSNLQCVYSVPVYMSQLGIIRFWNGRAGTLIARQTLQQHHFHSSVVNGSLGVGSCVRFQIDTDNAQVDSVVEESPNSISSRSLDNRWRLGGSGVSLRPACSGKTFLEDSALRDS